jgi:hypothetical protein
MMRLFQQRPLADSAGAAQKASRAKQLIFKALQAFKDSFRQPENRWQCDCD